MVGFWSRVHTIGGHWIWLVDNTGGRGWYGLLNLIYWQIYLIRGTGGVTLSPLSDTQRVSGFYSQQLRMDEGVAIWTLTGLKRFYHKEGTSVYYYRDVCAQAKDLQSGIESPKIMTNIEEVYFDIPNWQQNMRSEYLITLQWVEEDGRRVVDKLWSVSGKYRVLGQVGGRVCN